MIRYLKGILAAKEDAMAIIEVNGIGYEVNVPSNSAIYLTQEGDPVMVYTHVAVREDDISYFGFASEQELQLFKLLITVNGVGAKAALAILSALPVSEIKKAIVFEDAAMITRANGIGKKTAQKIVLELKDKLSDIRSSDDDGVIIPAVTPEMTDNKEIALDALMNLGFTRAEALSSMVGVEGDLSPEEYIKAALKNRV